MITNIRRGKSRREDMSSGERLRIVLIAAALLLSSALMAGGLPSPIVSELVYGKDSAGHFIEGRTRDGELVRRPSGATKE